MNKKVLLQDMEHMEEVMQRTADRSDIWQDRCVYWIAVAVWHILKEMLRREQ